MNCVILIKVNIVTRYKQTRRKEKNMKIAIGCDHGGIVLKQACLEKIEELGFSYVDFGTYDEQSVDYPVYAAKVAKAVQSGEFDKGVLLCGTV